MKRHIIILLLLQICVSASSQKFIRYYMNDSTYNGFYTDDVESIIHECKSGVDEAIINAHGKMYEIPVAGIDSIVVENALVGEGDVGQYRIYEVNYDAGDVKNVKKIYVDNRACMLASHNGDFGANDTILFSSAYNDIKCLFFTDDQGRVKHFFDGNKLFYFDYDNENEIIALDLSTGETKTFTTNKNERNRVIKAPSSQTIRSLIEIGTSLGFTGYNNLLHYLASANSNPEYHGAVLLIDAAFLGIDALGIALSLAGGIPTAGLSLVGLGTQVGLLLNDCVGTINDIFPDSERMKKYKEYYKNKYSISVTAIKPENVTYTSATLCGQATSKEGFKGTLTFYFDGVSRERCGIQSEVQVVQDDKCQFKANVTGLDICSNYDYYVGYSCTVDGLEFNYISDNYVAFSTKCPRVYTGDVVSRTTKMADVACQFGDVPSDAVLGVEYSCDGEKGWVMSYTTKINDDYIFTLSPLKAGTTYTYRAFCIIDGQYYYDYDSKTLTTLSPSAKTYELVSKTKTSAIVNCWYSNAEGYECGVKVRPMNEMGAVPKEFKTSSENGERHVSLTGLTPATSYEYWAYVKADGKYYPASNKEHFTTDSPSLAGTWSCTVTKSGGDTESLTINLTEDGGGSAKVVGDGTDYEASWSLGSDGQASVYVGYVSNVGFGGLSYRTYNFWGKVDSMDNPSKIDGNGSFAIGNAIAESGYDFKFSMSK